MKNFIIWIKEKINHFISGLDNTPTGMSLRKLLSVGFFWLISVLCIRYTDKDNLIMIITILTSMITALIITYTVGNIKERTSGLSNTTPDPIPDKPEEKA